MDGLQSFDDIINAFLSIFVASTMEGWVDMMYAIRASNGTLEWFYFVTLLLFIVSERLCRSAIRSSQGLACA